MWSAETKTSEVTGVLTLFGSGWNRYRKLRRWELNPLCGFAGLHQAEPSCAGLRVNRQNQLGLVFDVSPLVASPCAMACRSMPRDMLQYADRLQ